VSSGKLTLPLVGMPCNKGELTVVAEELALCRDEVLLQFSGRNLDRKDWFGKYVVWSAIFSVCSLPKVSEINVLWGGCALECLSHILSKKILRHLDLCNYSLPDRYQYFGGTCSAPVQYGQWSAVRKEAKVSLKCWYLTTKFRSILSHKSILLIPL